jgi:hypothetical protein
MAAIASVIEQAKLAEYARNEKALADRLTHRRSPISAEDRALLVPFLNWCEGMQVRHAPAAPSSVATFVREFNWRGPKILLPTLRAIEAVHDFFGAANPVATEAVKSAVAEMFNDDLADLIVTPKDAPRSWPKNEKILFSVLPKELQAIIGRRENERDQAVRSAQNEVSNLRNELTRLKLKDSADTKSVELEKETHV